MSAITSGNPNFQVRPSSGIYTALLTVALVFLVVTIIFIGQTTSERFGYTLPIGEEFEKAQKEPAKLEKGINGLLVEIKGGSQS